MADFDLKAKREREKPARTNAGEAAAPLTPLFDDVSIPNPAVEPGPILTLSAEEITRFFVRSRRDQDTERWDVRLDAAIGLGLTRAATAAPALRRQLAVEQAPRVRAQIERQLRALGESPVAPEKAPAPKQETPMRGSW